MDFASVLGIAAGATIVVGAIMSNGSISSFINVPSLLIVIGGALSATVVRFTFKDIFGALGMAAKLGFKTPKATALELLEQIESLSVESRKSGPLGLEKAKIDDDYLAKGVSCIVDGVETEAMRETLEKERDIHLSRLERGRLIFKALGDSAPAFGMIGTLVGLVSMLKTMDDPSTIGPSMAVALLTTLYGALIANMVCLPMADKLAMKLETEMLDRSLILDGVLMIKLNQHPMQIRETLLSYLPPEQRPAAIADA